MKKVILLFAIFALGIVVDRIVLTVPTAAQAVVEKCSSQNGDVNGDESVDLSDAVAILGNLFLGNPAELLPLCKPPTPTLLPATGQRICYDASGAEVQCDSELCPGQDGFYLAGCVSEGRFVDNGDGTVSDMCTGLMWQKTTGAEDKKLSGCEALMYCEQLELAGHNDWRLPNVRELQSIVDYGRWNPSIAPEFGAVSSLYWSSTTVQAQPNPRGPWVVGFLDGFVGYDSLSEDYYVRAVRTLP